MAFIAGTPILTSSGWKNVEDISGRDKVLVRNFIGDAELIQPFALKKSKYDGEIVKIGAKDWHFSLTPNHTVVYEQVYKYNNHYEYVPAIDVGLKKYNRIHRKFRYMFADDPAKESIFIWDDFGRRSVTIDHIDWYKLVGYVLTRGSIRKYSARNKRFTVFLYLKEGREQKDIAAVGDILDRYGIPWSVGNVPGPVIIISSKNTLAARLVTRLGARNRKQMSIPDKMVYHSTRELTKVLIETIIDTYMQPDSKRGKEVLINSTNKDFCEQLCILGTLGGYGMSYKRIFKAGDPFFSIFHDKDGYSITINSGHSTYMPVFKDKFNYSGYVYEIDLFDGQVYTREGRMPVWVNPK